MGCCGGPPPEGDGERPREVLQSRRNVCCTDILFLLLFLAFWGLLLYIAVFAFMQGDAKRLLYGYDSFGNTCNQKNNKPITNLSQSGRDTSGMSNVFFMRVLDPRNAMQVCVRTCPPMDINTKEEAQEFAIKNNTRLCSYDVEPKDYLSQDWTSNIGPCPKLPIFKSISFLSRCVPDPTYLISERYPTLKKFLDIIELDDIFRKCLSDIYIIWRELLVLGGISVGIAFLMVLMMRFFACIIVWLIVVLAALGSIAGTGVLWWTYAQEHIEVTRDNITHMFHIPVVGIDIQNQNAFLIFSIVATVLTVILLLILLVMRSRISLVVALFNEAGKCLTDVPLLLIQPLWTFVILLAFFAYWLIVLAFIATLGTPLADNSRGFLSVKYNVTGFPKQFWWIHVIGLIWTSEFILACQQFVIAGSVALWYFSRQKNSMSCVICKSTCRLVLHHLGSVAFGSLIITLIKIPRYILMYLQRKCEGSQNACAKCCLKCCICCLYCLEKCVKFLNQNAYTIIAIDGNNFCSSAQKAFSILTSNVLRVIAINSVGAFVLFLGKIGVMATTCTIAVFWLKSITALHFYAIPVILICFFSFLIAHCFLSVYEMVVDALLLCFCEDCQMNDGSPGREYYMNTSLMEFVQNSSAKLDTLKRSKTRQVAKPAVEPTELQQMK